MHRLRELCAGVCPPAASTSGRRQPARRPGQPGRALGLRLRDQLPAASTATSAWRPAPPRPSPSRSCSSSPSPTARTPSTPSASSVVGDDGPKQLPWEDWPTWGWPPTRRPGCAPPPPGQRRLRGPGRLGGELGYGVRARARAGQTADAERPATPSPDDSLSRTTSRRGHEPPPPHDAWIESSSWSPAIVPLRCVRRHPLRNPVHNALSPRRHPVRHRRALHHPRRRFLAAVQGHRLRRRHRGALPVRDRCCSASTRLRTSASTRSSASARRHPDRARWPGRPLVALLGGDTGHPAPRHRGHLRHRPERQPARPVLFTDYLLAFEITSVLLLTRSACGRRRRARQQGRRHGTPTPRR